MKEMTDAERGAMSVQGKRIVVTGAAQGIGAEAAAELGSRGAEVITLDVADGADLVCDIADAERVDAVFDEIGAIDGLLNNAGLIVRRKNHDEIPLDEWDRVFAVNVKGTFLCSRAAVRNMPNGGSIVNVASATALSGSQGFVHYVASKDAVVSLTRALANEVGARRIRVNCVAPGYTITPGSAHLGQYDATRTPLGRVMEPADLLGTFCYLLSDDSAFVSGQTMVVDGGRQPH
jgi:NAD(P)-dependent dehydrogenase (short-subunit alcohol dehydrogenase family)